jgi:hypothetical protein
VESGKKVGNYPDTFGLAGPDLIQRPALSLAYFIAIFSN